MHCNTLQHTYTTTDLLIFKINLYVNPTHFTATHCNTLQHTCTATDLPMAKINNYTYLTYCTATHCNALQRTATHCNIPARPQIYWWPWAPSVCCSALRCSLLHVVAVQPLQQTATLRDCPATKCNNNTATDLLVASVYKCNTLQHTATHCNTLQHTATRNY